ncbi:MAG: sialidase family protein, partial [Candidatus Thermoplasmatota archaeon]|nr:sialidase family protein [Candidatus Thermoplasmatota archaeon]
MENKELAINWSEDILVSEEDSHWSYSPDIGALNTTVHILWSDAKGAGYYRPFLWYAKSLDGGKTWKERNLSTRGYASQMGINDNALHIAFEGSGFEVYYKRSLDNGDNWGLDILLSENDGYISWAPQIAVSGDNIHVVWTEKEKYWPPKLYGEIVYMRSTDNGNTWDDGQGNEGIARRLTYNFSDSEKPLVAVNGTTIHIFWRDNRYGNYEVFYKRSDDNGAMWSEDKNITVVDSVSSDPYDVVVDGNKIYLVGYDMMWFGSVSESYWGVWFIYSNDSGKTWNNITYLAPLAKRYAIAPSIAVSGNQLYVVWYDNRSTPDTNPEDS